MHDTSFSHVHFLLLLCVAVAHPLRYISDQRPATMKIAYPFVSLSLVLMASHQTSAKMDGFQSKGSSYQASGGTYYPAGTDCPYQNSVYASISTSQDKFKSMGPNGWKTTNEYQDRYVEFWIFECDGANGVTKTFGGLWESGPKDLTFSLESKKYSSATLSDMRITALRQFCTIQCDEYCWEEIFGYGTCPPYESYVYCYDVCDDLIEDGIAVINVVWTSGAAAPYQSRSVSHDRSKGTYSSVSKSNGTFRDATIQASVKVDGRELLPAVQDYSWGYISSLSSMSVWKSIPWEE